MHDIDVRPDVHLDDVVDALAAWGVEGIDGIRVLASEADRTMLVTSASGDVVFKQSPIGSSSPAMQVALLDAVHRIAPELPVPRLLVHRETGTALSPDGSAFVSTLCPGTALEAAPLDVALVDAIADAQAALLAALAPVHADTAFVPMTNDWSLDAVLRHESLIERHLAPHLRPAAEEIVADFRAFAAASLATLESQVIHADFNLSNLLVEGGALTGIIDFGDAVCAARIFDVAVTATYLAIWAGDVDAPLVVRYLARIGALVGLSAAERAAIPLLMRCRLLIVLCLGRESAERAPERAAYQLRYDAAAERVFSATVRALPQSDPQKENDQ